ncbi:unnamed protein product [Closterium sp. NIES-54]
MRKLLRGMQLPYHQWPKAMDHAVMLHNLLSSSSLPNNASPHLLWTPALSVLQLLYLVSLPCCLPLRETRMLHTSRPRALTQRRLRAPREWHDTLSTTLVALGFAPSIANLSLFLHTNTLLPPFYVLVYVDDLVFATADTEALTLVKSELQKRHTCTDLGEIRSYLGLQITRDRAQPTIILTQSHMVHQVLQRFGFHFSSPQRTPLSTGHSLSAPPSDESVEPTGPYPEIVGCLIMLGMGLVLGGLGLVVLTSDADVSWQLRKLMASSSLLCMVHRRFASASGTCVAHVFRTRFKTAPVALDARLVAWTQLSRRLAAAALAGCPPPRRHMLFRCLAASRALLPAPCTLVTLPLRLPDALHPRPPGQPTASPPRPTRHAPACYPIRPPVGPAVAAEFAPAVWGEGVEGGGGGGGGNVPEGTSCCPPLYSLSLQRMSLWGKRGGVRRWRERFCLASSRLVGGRVRWLRKFARHLQLPPAATVAPPTAAPASTCCFFCFVSAAVGWQVQWLSLAVPLPLPPHTPALQAACRHMHLPLLCRRPCRRMLLLLLLQPWRRGWCN